jgi:hypothetical protein
MQHTFRCHLFVVQARIQEFRVKGDDMDLDDL